jgi:SAM-dependent methyltransferase
MLQAPKTIYDDGRHYDLLMPGPNDLPFYRRMVERHGQPVLELGCGTGRLTVALAQDGVDITGLDDAPTMLEEARQKAARAGVSVEFVQGDCRDFALAKQYSLIFFPNNALSHLLTRTDVEACFRSVREHLLRVGRFVVDLFVPSARILGREAGRYPVGSYEDPDGRGRVTVTESNQYDSASQVNHITWYYSREGEGEFAAVPLKLRMFFPQEIDALLESNGFAIEEKYGDFEDTPFGSESQKQLIVCRKVSGG